MLPQMAYKDGITKGMQTVFAGYEHRRGAANGSLWDMQNLSSDEYPLLTPRRPRYKITTLEKPNGLYADDGLYWVDGTGFYAGGELKGTVEDSRKKFVSLGAYIILLPDLAYYNKTTGEFGNLQSSVTTGAGDATFCNGTIYEEEAEANTLKCPDIDFSDYFNSGDAVTIAGCTTHTENNQTPIIREISDDGHELRFYENTFTLDGDEGLTDYTEPGAITVSRDVPELDYICSNENRLWGCKGDTIYACKLGDPFNWNVFDGISTDSYAVSVGSAGDFTGACSYLGYPCFFKEENIYKVYGDKPSSFEVMGSASLGIEEGSWNSCGIAGEILFYLARSGIVAYSGGKPADTADAFGMVRYRNAVGGSDGVKYYVSMEDADGNWSIFVFDTRNSLWHREDGKQIIDFAWDTELYMLDSEGVIWLNGAARTVPEGAENEGAVEWWAEWVDFYEYSSSSSSSSHITSSIPNAKGIAKILVRIELEAGATCEIKMLFDSQADWLHVASLTAQKKRSYYLPIIPRRTDHFRFRLEGTGVVRLYSLTREYYVGSENKVL